MVADPKEVFKVEGQGLQEFRERVLDSSGKCVDKVVEILDRKCSKLKEIVEVMRKLASYTLGKR